MTGGVRRRVAAGVSLAVLIGAGLVVAHALPDSAASDIAGDALYAVAAYAGLVLLFPRARPSLAAALALAWCVAIEVLQLTPIPRALAGEFPPAALVLGSGFDPRDLVVYVAAVASGWAVDRTVRARSGMTTTDRELESI